MTTWTHEDDIIAGREGWGVFNNSDHGIRIERIDDMFVFNEDGDGSPVFEGDDDALAFVQRWALDGSDLHKRALAFIEEKRKS